VTSERELTARLRAFFPQRADVRVGVGDDAAVVGARASHVALCCDPVIEGVHFLPETPLELVGRKAVNRNLSDLAATGADADWLLVSVVVPRSWQAAQLMRLLRGVRSAALAAGAVVVGGDLAVADAPLVVTVTAAGNVRGRALLRSDLRVGDTLHVTGPLGGSIDGHHLKFRPHVCEGRWLAAQRAVGGATDVSDGLALDLATMLEASGVPGAELDAAALPVRAAARRLAKGDRDGALQRALHDGEDHVLLFSVRRGAALSRGGPLTARARRPIGRVVAEPGLRLRRAGALEDLDRRGFEHEVGR